MRKINIVLVLFMVIINSCKPGTIKKQENMFEKFDFEKFKNENREYREHEYSSKYILKDKMLIVISYPEIFILLPTTFYITYKEFYNSGNIKIKGTYFGDYNLGSYSIKIHKWYYFDEKGKLIKEINEDEKFGKFGYNDLLKFVANEGYINLKTGENRENLKVNFFHSATSNKKLWQVIITLSKTDIVTDLGSGFEYKVKRYFLDGNTGKELTKEELRNYTGIGFDYKYNFPEQKREIYKTYEGKSYTEKEWKMFEQKLWDEFQKKNKK